MANTKKIEKQIIELQKKLQAENEKKFVIVGETMVKELGIEDAVSFKKFVKMFKGSFRKAYENHLEEERKASEQKQQEVVGEMHEHTENGMGA